jgi:hypothetical protein
LSKKSNPPPLSEIINFGLWMRKQDQVTHAPIANGYTAKSACPPTPYDVLIQVDDKTVGLDIKIVTGNLSDRKFDEIVGHLLT